MGILSSPATSLEEHNHLSSNPATATATTIPQTKLNKSPALLLKSSRSDAPCPSKSSHHLEERTCGTLKVKRGLQQSSRRSHLGSWPLGSGPSHLFQRFTSPPLSYTNKSKSTTPGCCACEHPPTHTRSPAAPPAPLTPLDTPLSASPLAHTPPSRPPLEMLRRGLFPSPAFGPSFGVFSF